MMKKIVVSVKKIIYSRFLPVLLVISLIAGQLVLLSSAFAAEPGPVVELRVANKIDVQLAVGPTSVDYSRFEADLRAALEAKPYPIPKEDLFITASQAVEANTTSEFTWWVYDHTMPNSASALNAGGVSGQKYQGVEILDDTTHTYVEVDNAANQTTSSSQGTIQSTNPAGVTYTPYDRNPDIGKTWHPYIGIHSHMIESNSGATMDFYGYSTHSFKDFRYLPNNQKTIKTFEFAIAEDLAFDALDGVGFLFNTDITGSYTAGAQTMSGYLLFLQYTSSGVGSEMAIYKFDGINTKDFHHAKAATSGGGLAAFRDRNSIGFTKVASSTVYTSTDYSRRIKIEVSPTYVRAWYSGSKTKNDSAVLTSAIDEYATPINFTMTTGGEPGQTSGTAQKILLNDSIIKSYGFGPLSSYIGHACARPTHIALQNLSMTVERVRTLPEVVRDPEWNADTMKFLVNLNEQEIEDFSINSITAELLARLTQDDIYYIGWCADINAQQSLAFLQKHDLKGTVVNIEEEKTDTYQKQIQSIADEVYSRYWQGNDAKVFLVTDKVQMEVSGASRYNTADPEWPDGKWMVLHHPTGELGWDSGDEGTHPLSGQYLSDLEFTFNYPGEYDIYYRDAIINSVTSHRAPVASFDVDFTDPDLPIFTNTSYDPDDRSAGIVSSTFSWIDINTMDSPLPGLPDQLESDHLYLITLIVTDKLGATSSVARQISVTSAEIIAPKNPPYAAFTLNPPIIMKNVGNQNVTIQNISYDLYGAAITSSFSVKKDGVDFPGWVISGEGTGSHDTAALNLPLGNYRVYLTVESENGVSQTVSEGFEIIVDTAPPTASANPTTATFSSNQNVNLTFSDTGGSGFYRQRVIVTASNSMPSSDASWSSYSTSISRTININKEGSSYIHWEAWDNAGNKGAGTFGPYTLEKLPTTLTLTASPPVSQTFGGAVTLTATLPEGVYDGDSRIYFYVGTTLLGGALINDNIASFSFTPASAGALELLAEFPGDTNHNGSSDGLSYTVTKSDAATVSLAEQSNQQYNAAPFEPSGITVIGANSYKLIYNGANETSYGPTETPPTHSGEYTITLLTTDSNYEEKSASRSFAITQIPAAIMLTATVGEQTTTSGQALDHVELTAVITNAIDAPVGSVSFYIDDNLIDTVPISYADGVYKAVSGAWTSIPGGEYNITALYNSASGDNYGTGMAALMAFSSSKLEQTGFSFTDGLTKEVTFLDTPFTVTAEGGESAGNILYQIVSGDGVVSFDSSTGEVTILKAGIAVIHATKAGDDYYNQTDTTITITVLRSDDTVTVTVPDQHFGTALSVTASALGNGMLTYSYTGRGDTQYGPSSTPPTAVGTYTLTVTSSQTTNYHAGSGSADFEILPCGCAITALAFDGHPIEIPPDKPQTSVFLNASFDYHLCGHHTDDFMTTYSMVNSKSATIKDHELTVNTQAVGTTVVVTATILHIPTGISMSGNADFPVTRGKSSTTVYDKNTDDDLVIDITSFNDEVDKVRLGNQELFLGEHYVIEDGKIIIKKEVLNNLFSSGNKGNEIKIDFKGGESTTFTVNVKEGKMTFDCIVSDKLPHISVQTPVETIYSALTDQNEHSMINEGYDVHIELVVNEFQSTEEMNAIKNELGARTAGMYFDVSISKSVAGGEKTRVRQLSSPIVLSVKLPEDLQRHARYWVLRAHTNESGGIDVTPLEVALVNGGEMAFETDLFSTIAIVYSESKTTSKGQYSYDKVITGAESNEPGYVEGPGKGYMNPQTGDVTSVWLWLTLTVISGTGLILLRKGKKKGSINFE